MIFNCLAAISGLVAVTLAAPLSTASLSTADFATNVIMTSGASQFAMWVPTDGETHAISGISCLNILSSSVGSCSISAIDQVAAISGYTCGWSGVSGWTGSQVGTDDSGWLPVSPPQTLSTAICVAS